MVSGKQVHKQGESFSFIIGFIRLPGKVLLKQLNLASTLGLTNELKTCIWL
jgi:hypothetical protein